VAAIVVSLRRGYRVNIDDGKVKSTGRSRFSGLTILLIDAVIREKYCLKPSNNLPLCDRLPTFTYQHSTRLGLADNIH
jgi:hypothetical protein